MSYLILCRSLTYAQRTNRILDANGIFSRIVRTPKLIAKDGCGHCVQIRGHDLARALQVLKQNSLTPKRVYIQQENQYDEVEI